MREELRLEVAHAAFRAESFLIAQATENPVADTDVVAVHGDLTLTRDDLIHLINAARGYLPAYQTPDGSAARGLLKRILEAGIAYPSQRSGTISDNDGYREITATPEELDYLVALRDE